MKENIGHIDQLERNDNRDYDYSSFHEDHRAEYDIICSMIHQGASVLDLGCGNGSLLQLIRDKHQAQVSGMELSHSGVEVCRAKGLDVLEGRIDMTLPYADNQFDIAICNVTIQMVQYPEVLLREMIRVSKKQIVSFPNFAYFKNRWDLLFAGRMPKPMLFGYHWYDTGHIHQLSLRDFAELLDKEKGLEAMKCDKVPVGKFPVDLLARFFPNLFVKIAIIELEKKV